MADKKVVNINVMRPAFKKQYEMGNRGAITKEFCADLKIEETYFKCHVEGVHKLYEAVCKYCRLKNSVEASPEALKTAQEAIFPIWKELLSNAESKKYEKELRCRPDDVSNLVGFCQKFLNSANNSFGEEKFVTTRQWATQAEIAFRKQVETDLGIRIAQIDVMPDDKRDFITAEGKALSAIRRFNNVIAELEKKIKAKGEKLKTAKAAETKEMLTAEIAELDTLLKEANKKLGEKQSELDTVYIKFPKYAPTTTVVVAPAAAAAATV